MFVIMLTTLLTMHAFADINGERAYKTPPELQKIFDETKVIKTTEGWFQILKLPHNVYALNEPGHQENVNAFFILGAKKDLLYDTGMGIGNIKQALSDLRTAEHLPKKPLMVINSHSHLDHRGGNAQFGSVYVYKNQRAVRKLSERIPAGQWEAYYDQLTGLAKAPADFNPKTFSYAPIDKTKIKFLKDGQIIDLGDRQLKVLATKSHTPDSILLYEGLEKLLFTGDAFGPDYLIVRDMDMLEDDLKLIASLKVNMLYNTHGVQLVDTALRARLLKAVEAYQQGDYSMSKIQFAGQTFTQFIANGFHFVYAPCFLMQV